MSTLVLYDAENMKVPLIQMNNFIVSRINMEDFTRRVKDFFPDINYNFISFNKRHYWTKDKRNDLINKHKFNLEKMGYTVVEKTVSTKSNVILEGGKRRVYEYEECDMDAEIIHHIHTLGKRYSRIILVSGDRDMKTSLDYIKEQYNSEIWIISHKERLSAVYKENNVLELQVLMGEDNK